MNTIGLNTQMGIDLAQQGRGREALAYLRHAVRTEPVTADIWLWLAHVTPDIDEYRNCVYQALQLEPQHPTALRMQQDISFQSQGGPPPLLAADAAHTMAKPHKRSIRWRRILILLNAIVLVAVCGRVGAYAISNIDRDDLSEYLPFLEQSKRIRFAVGGEDDAVSFRIDVPETWVLADVGSPLWRDERDRLINDFPELEDTWTDVELDLSIIQPNPINGTFRDPIVIIETDNALIEDAEAVIPQLALDAFERIDDDIDDTSCESLRFLASEFRAEGEQFIGAEVRERDDDSCIFITQIRDRLDNVEVRIFTLQVPIDDERLATWRIRIPEALYRTSYKGAVDTIIETLLAIDPEPIAAE